MEIIHKVCDILDMIKDFTTSRNSKSRNKMLIDYNGKRYKVTFEEIDNPSENIFDDVDRYLYM